MNPKPASLLTFDIIPPDTLFEPGTEYRTKSTSLRVDFYKSLRSVTSNKDKNFESVRNMTMALGHTTL